MPIILGVDGGGSRTLALVADAAGTILGAGEAGSCNHQSVGFAAATEAIQVAKRAALARAALAPDTRLAAACLGLAGAGRPEDQARFMEWARARVLARRCLIVNDAELVLAAGAPEGWGVALISGTGSFCWARAPNGRTARAGGWGYLLGDEGSGYDLAIQALRAAAQTADGRAQAQQLLRAILDYWGLDEPARLIRHIYRPEMTRAEIARLSEVVLKLADARDAEALKIVNQAAAELGKLVTVVARKLELQNPSLAFAGGLLGASQHLRAAIVSNLDVAFRSLTYVDDPARGALVLAARLLESSEIDNRG